MPLPFPVLAVGWVVGAVLHADADGPDADRNAEAVYNIGTVTFTPKTNYHLESARIAVTRGPVVALLDSHGDIHPQRSQSDNTGDDAEDGISLPVGTYTVTYKLQRGLGLPSHDIVVTSDHTPAAPLELFTTIEDPPDPAVPTNTMTDAEISAALGG